jgi:hypothetical protein
MFNQEGNKVEKTVKELQFSALEGLWFMLFLLAELWRRFVNRPFAGPV